MRNNLEIKLFLKRDSNSFNLKIVKEILNLTTILLTTQAPSVES